MQAMTLTQTDGPRAMRMVAEDTTDVQVVEWWLADKPSRHTRRSYRLDGDLFMAWVGKPMRRMTWNDLRGYVTELEGQGHKAGRRARAIHAVKSLFKFAFRLGYIQVNPAELLRAPKVQQTVTQRVLARDDVLEMIVRTEDARDKAALTLLYASKIRESELCGLCWGDLTAAPEREESGIAGFVTVTGKGEKQRTIGLPAKTWGRVCALRPEGAGEAEPVFLGQGGKAVHPSTVWHIVKRAAKRAGVPGWERVSPHWMRHSGASHALDAGCPVHVVKQDLGHANLSTTTVYVHARPDQSSATYLAGV